MSQLEWMLLLGPPVLIPALLFVRRYIRRGTSLFRSADVWWGAFEAYVAAVVLWGALQFAFIMAATA